jgi:hypothetical protein
VRGRRLTTWAMARPTCLLILKLLFEYGSVDSLEHTYLLQHVPNQLWCQLISDINL